MKIKEIEVLSKILTNNYVNTDVLSKELKISVRSVRYIIASLKVHLNNHGCELKYSNKRGYYFSKSHRIKVELLINELFQNKIIISTPQERQMYILGKLLFKNQVEIDQLMNEIYISRSSILHDLTELKLKYSLEHIIKNNTVRLKLSDVDKLVLVTNVLIDHSQHKQDINDYQLKFFFNNEYNQENIRRLEVLINNSSLIVDNRYLKFQHYWLTYYLFTYFNLDFMVQNYHQAINNDLEYMISSFYKQLMLSIGITHEMNIDPSIVKTTIEFMQNLSENYNLNIDRDNYAFDQLLFKVNALYLQNKFEIDFKFKLSKRLIRIYPYSFSIAQQLINYNKLTCNRDQVAYLCEVIQEIVFESNNSNVILIVTNIHNHIIDYYIEWITYEYTKNIRIEVIILDDFQPKMCEQMSIKLVINFTTQELKISEIQVMMDQVISLNNIKRLDQVLRSENGNVAFMKQFIRQSLLKIYLNQISLSDVLKYTSKQLAKRNYIDNHQIYYKECIKREKVGTTYVGYQTMIVHPIHYHSKSNVVYIVLLKEPIITEGNQVHLILVCAFKAEIDFEISRLFEIIMRIIEEEEHMRRLYQSESEMDLILNFNEIINNL